MIEFLEVIKQILMFMLDLFTVALIVGVFYVVGLSMASMVRNRQARWGTIFFMLAILFLGIWLLQWYPPQVIRSIRAALVQARPEAEALRQEMELWLPEPPVLMPSSTITVSDGTGGGGLLLHTPAPTLVVPTAAPMSLTFTPSLPTPTLAATATMPPPTWTPTVAPIPTLDLTIWNQQTPAPTPPVATRSP